MKRILFSTVLILTVLLTSCGTLEVSIVDPSQPTPIASASLEAGPTPLTVTSTSEEIRQALLESPFRWRTIFMDAQVTSTGEAPQRVQAWVDQPNLSLRILSGSGNGSAETLRVANGMSLLDLDIPSGKSNLSPFLPETMHVPFTPQPFGQNPHGVAEPHPLSASVYPALGELIFPSDVAQNAGTFKPVAMEVVAFRLCLTVDWTAAGNSLPSYRAWVDVSTGVFLRLQQFDKGGGTQVLSEVTATRVNYDLPFSSALFSVEISALPDFATDPEAPSYAAVTPAAESVMKDPLGLVYSFVADNNYPVRAIRLVRVPASCVVGDADCPEPEVIKPPVDLTSSLQPLVWSPTRIEAAWAYPINADARIWTLYLFDPRDKSWKELAQFDRYMDPPMWSQDGNWLAFRLQDGNGGSEVYAIRRDGTDTKVLTGSNQLPADGKPYVMDSWLDENALLRSVKGAVYSLNVENGRVEPLSVTLPAKSPLVESPDGTLLAYVDSDGKKQIVKVISPDGKISRDMATFSTGSVLGLAWSPDGKQLGFSILTDTSSSVYVIDSDGRNLRQVYTSATDTEFVFSPDGKYILVQTIDGTGEHLYAIDLSTLAARLVQVPGIALNEAWMFPSWTK